MPKRIPTHKPRSIKVVVERPSPTARGYGGSWPKLRRMVLNEEPVCQDCGREPSKHVDHVRALEAGGTNDRGNLRALCHSCHSRKTCREDGGFGRKRKEG